QHHGSPPAHPQRRGGEPHPSHRQKRGTARLMTTPVLDIKGLRTVFAIGGANVPAVQDLDLTIEAGETVALVGESGSGKSVTSLSIMGLLPRKVGRIAAGSLALKRKSGDRVELETLNADALRQIRGNDMGMIFQEPMTSLNPVYTVGE